MKLRVGACALMLVLAGCSGEIPESGMAGMRGVAASKATGSLPTSLPLARAIGASIANAPDRGALLSYSDKAKPTKQEGAYTWFPIAISEAHAFKGIATGEMTVPSPDGSQLKLRYERHVEEIDGNWTWIGRVVGGDPMQEAIITFGEKAVFGSIPQADGKPALSLQTRNGAVFAVQTDPSKVVSATKGYEDVMIPEAATLRSSMAAAVSQSAQVSQGATAIVQAAPPTAANTIDVAIGYTPEFAAANGGASGAATRLVYLIQVGNQALSNSDVNGYLRIVNALQVSYTSANTNQTALSELTGSTGNSPVTIPAGLAPLRTARDQYGADIAVLVRKFNTPENEGCGIAWLNGANQTAITSADASWGYAVISDGYDTGADGKTYYCADETLVHEAAHLMGSAHDRANSTTTGGALQYGRFPYSFGYKTAAAAGNFYTVMAYGDTGQIAHRIFSTPLKSTCGAAGNLACGVANNEDNARSLNQTIPVVSAFRATVVPIVGTGWKRDDHSGDGRTDLLWKNADAISLWLMDGGSVTGSGYAAYLGPGFQVVAQGDFDGDGRADLAVGNGSQLRILKSNGDRTYTQIGTHYYSVWRPIGAGDLDGDGKSDIFWTDGGAVTAWLMDGGNVKGNAYAAWHGPNTQIISFADFDGDGRVDFVASNGSTLSIWMNERNNTFKAVAWYGIGAGWTPFAVADLNGDGKSDILYRSGLNLSAWLMNGSSVISSPYVAWIGQSATVVAIGDYNNDGKADFATTESGNRVRFWINNGNGTAFTTNMSYTYSGWTPFDPAVK